jgi:hypothetical protein
MDFSSPRPDQPGNGWSLSEKLFAVLMVGTVLGILALLHFRKPDRPAAERASRDAKQLDKVAAYLTRVETAVSPDSSGKMLQGGATVSAAGDAGTIAVRPSDEELRALQAAHPSGEQHSLRHPDGGSVARPESPPAAAATGPAARPPAPGRDTPLPDADSLSVFVPAKIGLAYQAGGRDAWPSWPDANQRNITGTAGVESLAAAFDLVDSSRARALTAALFRKGIAISFGDAADFAGEMSGSVAFFQSDPSQPAGQGRPVKPPEIKFNPAFLHEDPRVLAAALVHEATHFQQFLDGSLQHEHAWHSDHECDAWWNEAAFWDEARTQVGPIDTPLEQQFELGYRATLRGEAALKTLLTAIQ